MNDRDRFLNQPEPVEGLRAACLDLTGHLSSGPAAVRLARSLYTLLALVIGALRPVAAAKSAATPSGELTPEHVLEQLTRQRDETSAQLQAVTEEAEGYRRALDRLRTVEFVRAVLRESDCVSSATLVQRTGALAREVSAALDAMGDEVEHVDVKGLPCYRLRREVAPAPEAKTEAKPAAPDPHGVWAVLAALQEHALLEDALPTPDGAGMRTIDLVRECLLTTADVVTALRLLVEDGTVEVMPAVAGRPTTYRLRREVAPAPEAKTEAKPTAPDPHDVWAYHCHAVLRSAGQPRTIQTTYRLTKTEPSAVSKAEAKPAADKPAADKPADTSTSSATTGATSDIVEYDAQGRPVRRTTTDRRQETTRSFGSVVVPMDGESLDSFQRRADLPVDDRLNATTTRWRATEWRVEPYEGETLGEFRRRTGQSGDETAGTRRLHWRDGSWVEDDEVRVLRVLGDHARSIDFIARMTGIKPESVEAAIATLVYSRQLEWADAAHETVRRVQPDLTAPTGVDSNAAKLTAKLTAAKPAAESSAKSYDEVLELIWTALCDPKGLTIGRIHQLTALSPATIHRTLALLDVELIEGEGDSSVSTAPRYRLRRTRDASRVETMDKPTDKPTAVRQGSAPGEETMKSMTAMQLFGHYCRAAKLWGMMIRFTPPFTDDDWTGFRLACPYHKQLSVQHAFDGEAFLYFDTEEEMRALYEQTVGEDGPTKVNPYDGPFRVWAMTCGPDGRPRNENT